MAEEEKDDGYIRFTCKYCGKRLKVRKEQGGGDTIPCPRCGEPVTVPVTNLEDIAGADEMLDKSKGGESKGLDPGQLLKQLKEEQDQMGEKSEKPGSEHDKDEHQVRKWRPERYLGRVDELDHLRTRLNQIEDDAVEDLQRLLQNKDMSKKDKLREVENIAKERRQKIKNHCKERLDDVKKKRKKLKDREGVLGARAAQRLEQLDRTIQAMRLYLGRILGMSR